MRVNCSNNALRFMRCKNRNVLRDFAKFALCVVRAYCVVHGPVGEWEC